MGWISIVILAVPFPHFMDPVPTPRFVPLPVAQVQATAEVQIPEERPAAGTRTTAPPTAGHWEYRRVGRFRSRAVWVADTAPAPLVVERGPHEVPSPRGASPGAGCLPGGT